MLSVSMATSSSSSFPSLCFVAILLLTCSTATAAAAGGNVTDWLSLLDIKAKITADPLGALASWNHTTHFCKWPGVICGRRRHETQRVIRLHLQALKLSGSLSPHIGNLTFLKELLLQNNSFTQEIPLQIGRLRRLRYLALFNNSFSGTIPTNISGCPKLLAVSFAYNHLSGELPVELGSLLNLQLISADGNLLTGKIPSSLGNLSSLDTISMPTNYLYGSIPQTLGELRMITSLYLGGNMLSGRIPPSIFNLSSLTGFDVGDNQIGGTLPPDLGITLPYLQFLSVDGNHITGRIPSSISNLSDIEILQMGSNNLTGKVPFLGNLHSLSLISFSYNHLGNGEVDDLSFLSSLTNITTLEILGISGNNLEGRLLPEDIGNLSAKLTFLFLDSNQIFGIIPTTIGDLKNLERLDLWNNELSGTIPPNIGNLQNLNILSLSGNKFVGYVPSALGNLTKLITLDLSINNLQGSIPSSLANCKHLLTLDLSHNKLSGAIPPEILRLSSLSIYLNLSDNHLNGPLPIEVGNLENLGELDVSENMLTGEIPSSLGSCIRLERLLIQGNLFQGAIPSSFRALRGIRVLDFSRNNLSGIIPGFLAGFHELQGLNLSYNDFEGMVPTGGIFRNVNAALILGNSKLCGGIPEYHLPPCKSGRKTVSRKLKLIITVLSGLLGMTLVLSLLVLWFRKTGQQKPNQSYSENSLIEVSYQSLLKATDGFSTANLIGEGSYGSVYRGTLPQDGTVIAVKVLNLSHKGGSKSFAAECQAWRNIRHRNLVKVLTVCSSVDYGGNDFKALVYEFMVNGSLEDWLHPSFGSEAPRSLNFLQRLNTAIDVACALEYLHHHCETPMVHCDLKPSNVLLDENMVGHIGDFGLAKFLTEGIRSQTSSIGVKGTIGYAPPEYGIGSEVSTYGDVYSFGILLLEIFTGKRPTDGMFKDGLSLRYFVLSALPDQVAEVVDPALLQEKVGQGADIEPINVQNLSRTGNKRVIECLDLIFRIAISCSAEFQRERIIIINVATELCSIRDKFLRT